MKKTVVALLSSLAFAAPAAFAQVSGAPGATLDSATVAAVHELLDSMKYRDMMRASFDQARQNMPVMLRNAAATAINANAQLSADQKKEALAKAEADLPKALAAMDAIFADGKLVDELVAETVPLYARHFNAAEIRQIAAFYKTPVGAKQLTLMPQIMNEAMQISQRVINPRIGAVIEKLTQVK